MTGIYIFMKTTMTA